LLRGKLPQSDLQRLW